MGITKEKPFPKDLCLNLAALGVAVSVGIGTGHLLKTGAEILESADQKFSGVSPQQLPEAVAYIRQNDTTSYPSMEVYYIPPPKPLDVQEKLAYYKDLQEMIRQKEDFTLSSQNEVILPFVQLASLMTLGISFLVTRSGEIFKRSLY